MGEEGGDENQQLLPQQQPQQVMAEQQGEEPEGMEQAEGEGAAAPPPRSQRARMKEVYELLAAQLLASMTPLERVAYVDNASKGGTGWIHATTQERWRRLTDREVSAGINIRLLQPDVVGRPQCKHCLQPNGVMHVEQCTGHRPGYTARHNAIRDRITRFLTARGYACIPEPTVQQQPQLRADIQIGPAHGGAGLHPIYGWVDLKVKLAVSSTMEEVRTAAANAILVQPQYQEVEAAQLPHLKVARAQIEAVLTKAATTCRNNYAPAALPQPVCPLVISSGGTLQKEMYNFLKSFEADGVKRRHLMIDISVLLLKARARTYVLD